MKYPWSYESSLRMLVLPWALLLDCVTCIVPWLVYFFLNLCRLLQQSKLFVGLGFPFEGEQNAAYLSSLLVADASHLFGLLPLGFDSESFFLSLGSSTGILVGKVHAHSQSLFQCKAVFETFFFVSACNSSEVAWQLFIFVATGHVVAPFTHRWIGSQ